MTVSRPGEEGMIRPGNQQGHKMKISKGRKPQATGAHTGEMDFIN